MAMIVTLSGVVSEKLGDEVVLDVQGVGYSLAMTDEQHGRLKIGQTIKLYIYEHLREDMHDLYGFPSASDKQLFEQLLSVKNVGPKVALAVLSIGSSGKVRTAIAAGDVRLLQSAKGVGKRAAEQMVVELRDKVGLPTAQTAEDLVNRGGVNTHDEAVEGLVALGYSETDALSALQHVDATLPTEDRIKQALRGTPQ